MEPTLYMIWIAILIGAGGGLFRVLLGWLQSNEPFDMAKTPRQFIVGVMTGLTVGLYLLITAEAYTNSMLIDIFLINALGVITIDKLIDAYTKRVSK